MLRIYIRKRCFRVKRVKTIMVYRKNTKWKCQVCREHKPASWFCCVICGKWMGKGCTNESYDNMLDINDPRRFAEGQVSLHCHIWTDDTSDNEHRADLCKECCEYKILKKPTHIAEDLPRCVKRQILQYVSTASWWQ